MTIDSYDPPCPVQRGTYTKLKMTDDSIQITNIDKSFISARCRYFMSMKEIKTNSADRLNMLKLVSGGNIEVSDIEFKLPKPSYSYRTVQEILKHKKTIQQ